jgi:hypothetical protein
MENVTSNLDETTEMEPDPTKIFAGKMGLLAGTLAIVGGEVITIAGKGSDGVQFTVLGVLLLTLSTIVLKRAHRAV